MSEHPRASLRDRVPDAINNAAAAWVRLVSTWPRLTLIVLALLVIPAGIAASGLRMNTNTTDMLSANLPFQERANRLAETFPDEQHQIAVVVRSSDPDAADAAVAALLPPLTADKADFKRVFAPSADPYLVAHGLLYLSKDKLEKQLFWLNKASNMIAELRVDQTFHGFLHALDEATRLNAGAGSEAGNIDPLYAEAARTLAAEGRGEARPFAWATVSNVQTDAQTVRVISLTPNLNYSAFDPAARPLAAVRAAVAGLDPELAREVEIGVTGTPALQADEFSTVSRGLGLSMLVSFALTAILLRMALRSWVRAWLSLAALGLTLVLTAGFAQITIGSLNLISIAFVVLMFGLGINYAIHFIVNYDAYKSGAADHRVASARTAGSIGVPLFASALTTTLSFLAFAFTDFVGMAQLGIIGGAGIVISFVGALTLLPAVIALWPGLARGPVPQPLPPISPRLRRWIFRAAVGLGIASMALVPFSRFDADPMDMRSSSSPSVIAYQWIADDSSYAPMKLDVLVPNGEAALATAERLKALPEVKGTTWIADLIPSDQGDKLDLLDIARPSLEHAVSGAPTNIEGDTATDSPPVTPESLANLVAQQPGQAAADLARELRAYAKRRTPESDAALGTEIFRFFPLLVSRLAAQVDAGDVTLDGLPAMIRDHFITKDGRYRIEVAPKVNTDEPQALRSFVAAVDSVAPNATGAPDQIVGATKEVGLAMLQASALSLVGSLLIAWVVIPDRVRLVGAALPILLSASLTIAAGVALGLPFNYANVLVLPLMIGAGIDSGIFFSVRAGGRPGGPEADHAVAVAVFYGQVTTIGSFGTLTLSDHPGTASMGALLAISIAATLLMTFTVTPPIVELAHRRFPLHTPASDEAPDWSGSV